MGTRNLRAKTVRANIPVKRNTSEDAGSNQNNVINNSSSPEISEVVEEKNNHPVFPVKSVLKKSDEFVDALLDKENVKPSDSLVVDWDDLDAEDSGDPMMVSDYVVDIFEYLGKLEVIFNDSFIFISVLLFFFGFNRNKLLPVLI